LHGILKILLVANINSPHTKKWASALQAAGQTVALFSINPLRSEDWTTNLDTVYVPVKKGEILPLRYLSLYFELRKTIAGFKPDLVHAHYLTNYGFLAAIAAPSILISTAWGSDIFEFPKKSWLNKWVLKFIFKRSLRLISTSETMKMEMQNYTSKEIEVLPFGINFSQTLPHPNLKESEYYTIACFKRLEKVYGIDLLIKAFAEVQRLFPDKKFRLKLYGEGSQKAALSSLAHSEGVTKEVSFEGWLAPEKIYEALATTQLCVYLSVRESFGVALIEAMAAGCPLVVSDLPAFREVAGDKDNALFLDAYSQESAITKISYAMLHPEEMEKMRLAAYQSVKSRFELSHNIQGQVEIYKQVLSKNKV